MYGVPLNTYQAYNNYGGKSLYDFNSSGGKAVKVSFNRPYANPGASSLHDWYTRADLPLVSWLEQSGYDVSYGADNDLESGGVGSHRGYVVAPHSEYWSAAMRGALQSANYTPVGDCRIFARSPIVGGTVESNGCRRNDGIADFGIARAISTLRWVP